MPFWKRRPVIYNWDDNYVPTTEKSDFYLHALEYSWTCPADVYIEVNFLHSRFYSGAGIRSTFIDLHFFANQHEYYKQRLAHNIAQNLTYSWYLANLGGTVSLNQPHTGLVDLLPFNLRMIPGDRITLTVEGTYIVTDLWLSFGIRYNRYDLT